MDNTERLLRAFIDAVGYDIEELPSGLASPQDFIDYKVTKRQKKKQPKAVTNAYTDDFNDLWLIYPQRVGSNSKVDAFRAYNARITEKVPHTDIMQGVRRYNGFCVANGSINTCYVLQACTFMGKSHHYLNKWEVTKEMTMIKLPTNNDDLMAFATKHNLPQPGAGQSWPNYRELLQSKINLLNEG